MLMEVLKRLMVQIQVYMEPFHFHHCGQLVEVVVLPHMVQMQFNMVMLVVLVVEVLLFLHLEGLEHRVKVLLVVRVYLDQEQIVLPLAAVVVLVGLAEMLVLLL